MRIRLMTKEDTEEVFNMMRIFYDSPAVFHTSSDAVLRQDIEDCISSLPYIEGYVLEQDHEIAGYSMLAKSYSTEYGGLCIWIEDLYFKPQYRGKKLGREFFSWLTEKYGKEAVRFRLEVEPENEAAFALYQKAGYTVLPYTEMTKEMIKD